MKYKRKNKNIQKKMRKSKNDFQKYKIHKNDSVEMKQILRKSATKQFRTLNLLNEKHCLLSNKKKRKLDVLKWS